MRRLLLLAIVVAAAGLAIWTGILPGRSATPRDTTADITAELATWSAALADANRTGDLWGQVKPGATPVVAQAEQALGEGRLRMAVERLLVARQTLAAATWVDSRPAPIRTDLAAFEGEWARMAAELGLDQPRPAAEDVAPAGSMLQRAFEEAAFLQVKVNYDASLAYGRNTTPLSGTTYVGVARAIRENGALARTLVPGDGRRLPDLRSLRPDIDRLQQELLAAYRPPASLEKHPDFIATSALLKEARELDAAGLHRGALLRLLQAAMRHGMLRETPGTVPARADLAARAQAARARFDGGRVDHSLAALFVERAEFEIAHAQGDAPVTVASAILADVLPRYDAALEPAPGASSAAATPAITITLVRWPYT